MVDAAAVIGNFERMNRIADGTGIPIDAPVEAATGDLREELDLDRFASARNSGELSTRAKLLGPVVRAILPLALKAMRALGLEPPGGGKR